MRGGARHVADRDRGAGQPGRVPRRRAWRWAAGSLAVVVVLGAGTVGVAALRLRSNIRTVDVTRALGTDRPTVAAADRHGDRPLNVLVLGSDSREGANGFVGGKADEGRSDTTLVLHLSADRRRAVAVSIPRDSVVEMPSCVDRTGRQRPGAVRQFNDAYTIGGAACAQRTVEQLTGLRIDHYVVVDFAGFKNMVDALGTVPICLPEAVDDARHHITLPAGRSRVDGDQALSYVRERYALGDGGDLGRIDRQQAFISSVLQEATSAGTLTDPTRLYAFLSAATSAVTMDPGLAGLGTLTSLAKQVADIGLRNVQFVTVPNEPYAPDPNRLQWAPAARTLWKALRQDLPVTFAPRGTPTPTATPTGPGTLPGGVDPATVRIQVLNGTGVPGAAATAAAQLRDAGWAVVRTGDAEVTGLQRTRIVHGRGTAAARRAAALAAVLPGADVVLDPAAPTSALRLEVGADWTGPVAPPASPSGTPGASGPQTGTAVVVPGVQGRRADKDICAA